MSSQMYHQKQVPVVISSFEANNQL